MLAKVAIAQLVDNKPPAIALSTCTCGGLKAQVDATENSETADWLEVKGYPTLIWFSGGTRELYSGERTR